jgi:hypothetical protein
MRGRCNLVAGCHGVAMKYRDGDPSRSLPMRESLEVGKLVEAGESIPLAAVNRCFHPMNEFS